MSIVTVISRDGTSRTATRAELMAEDEAELKDYSHQITNLMVTALRCNDMELLKGVYDAVAREHAPYVARNFLADALRICGH